MQGAAADDGEPPPKRPRSTDQGIAVPLQTIRHSATHPKFLHSNSTSHQWAFGAFAELIDNAVDPDVAAKRMHIQVDTLPNGDTALILIDDGNGMNLEGLHKLLSFGYNTKAAMFTNSIGKYGNGFKSGSMRLGKDALVFTKPRGGLTKSCGFLSQTFLQATGATEVLIPMVSWDADASGGATVSAGSQANLNMITQHSPYQTEEQLLAMFARIDGCGTAIVIYNLRTEVDGGLELDFKTDPNDIRLRGISHEEDEKAGGKGGATAGNRPKPRNYQVTRNNAMADAADVPEDYSLREYCRVLYLEPRMQIFVRGVQIRTLRILKTTTRRKRVSYKPQNAVGVQYSVTFGFQVPEKKHLYGIMIYHHGRLIRPYVRVGVQLQPNEHGLGVLGVMEADFLDPTHNKQDFHDNQNWRRMLVSLAEKMNM